MWRSLENLNNEAWSAAANMVAPLGMLKPYFAAEYKGLQSDKLALFEEIKRLKSIWRA